MNRGRCSGGDCGPKQLRPVVLYVVCVCDCGYTLMSSDGLEWSWYLSFAGPPLPAGSRHMTMMAMRTMGHLSRVYCHLLQASVSIGLATLTYCMKTI